MESTVSDARGQSDRFHTLASAIRVTLPTSNDSEVRDELWQLVAHYEQLARYIEARLNAAIRCRSRSV
jgi:hypothetical protein